MQKERRLDQVRVTDDQNWVYLDHADEDTSAITNWFDAGVAKVCVYVDSEEALLELAVEGKARGFVVALIRDAGFTEFHGEPTFTCLAFEPLAAEDIDPLTASCLYTRRSTSVLASHHCPSKLSLSRRGYLHQEGMAHNLVKDSGNYKHTN